MPPGTSQPARIARRRPSGTSSTAGPSTNVEYVVLAGPAADLEAAVAGVGVRHVWRMAAG